MKILELNQSHIPEIVAIEHSAHLTPWSEKTISNSFGKRSHNYGLFKKDKNDLKLIGYFFCDLVAGELSIENICVAVEQQNKGLAKQLMTHLVELAKTLSAEEILLEVRTSNSAAIGLYTKFGFEQVCIRKEYYRIPNSSQKENALILKKVMPI